MGAAAGVDVGCVGAVALLVPVALEAGAVPVVDAAGGGVGGTKSA